MGGEYTRLVIRDMRVMMDIGVYEAEQGVLQPVLINVSVDINPPASPQADSYADTVCYATLMQSIRDIVSFAHVDLVETLAERIAAAALGMQGTLGVTVRVEKLEAQPDAAGVGVEIRRERA